MDIFLLLSHWLFIYQVWVIAAILLILLELLDGGTVFFLPLGLGALVNAISLFAVDTGLLPYEYLPETWYKMLIFWMMWSIAISALLAFRRKKRDLKNAQDLNEY
ncbi:MAG: hypothetical protein HRT36_08670 [Alphaproteobacteria bacterium]|nr:hypothetical protein [Alphaproteobacteria bacterium]